MNIKKYAIATIAVLAVLFSCASAQVTGNDDLDMAIRDASDYLNDNIPNGNKIVILNIQSDYNNLSEYIIDELIANAVNDKMFSVVDRAQLEAIRMELNFQLSGEVSDDSALEIGKFLGAQTIVSGAISELGDRHRMRIRALNVVTAEVQGQYNRNINTSKTIVALMKGGSYSSTSYGTRTASANDTSTGKQTTAQQSNATYKIGDIGPAGGIIFYDKGNRIGGWRYLEAAPADLPRKLKAVTERFNIDDFGGQRAVGRGITNTEGIMKGAASTGGGFGWAAQACSIYTLNGFDDWFLPSLDELNFIYGNLYLQEIGDLRSEKYWSSTMFYDNSYLCAIAIDFTDGKQHGSYFIARAEEEYRVRPIRQF